MSLPVIESPASSCCNPPAKPPAASACCAPPSSTKPGAKARGAGARTAALLAVGLAAWAGAYAAVFPLSELLTYRVLGLSRASRLGQSVAFFLYDAPKVL